MVLHDEIDDAEGVARPGPEGSPTPRRDGRQPPEAGPAEAALAIVRRLRSSRPDVSPDLDQVIATIEDLQMEVKGLRYALTARSTIDAAKGILIGEHGCDEDAAFEILKRLSQDTNVPLREVARAIVYGAQHPDPALREHAAGPAARDSAPPAVVDARCREPHPWKRPGIDLERDS